MKKLLRRIGYTMLIAFVLLNIMAAFHAYKFTHFYEEENSRELFRPEEAGFWKKVNALVLGIKSYKRPLDSIPTLYDTVSFITQDGYKLEAWQFNRATDSSGTVILFHGHGGNKAGVLNEARQFNNLGYKTLLVDFRAHGNSEGNSCSIGFEEAKDVKAAYDYIASTGEKNIILWGISLGAAAEMKAVADYGLKPSKLILEMPFGSLLEAVRGRCRILKVPQEPISTLLTFWGGVEQGFWAFDHNPQDYANKISCPVLLQWGVNDNRVSKSETETIFQNITSERKLIVKYDNSGHQSLCNNEKDKWVTTVSTFLKE